MKKHLLDHLKDKVEILSLSLAKNNAAILGAAATVWKEIELFEKYEG